MEVNAIRSIFGGAMSPPCKLFPGVPAARLKDMRDAPTEYHDGLTALGQAAGWLVVSSDVSSDNRE